MRYLTQDITTAKEDVIIHGVNAQGVMGSGVAGALRAKWPIVYKEYFKWYASSSISLLGRSSTVEVEPGKYVINLGTQEYYGNDGKVYASVEAIDKGLSWIAMGRIGGVGMTYAMPKIGCGLGGLDWEKDVEPIVQRHIPDAVIYEI